MALTVGTKSFELFDACTLIKQAAEKSGVGQVVFGDVTKLNELPDVTYPALVVTQREHARTEDLFTLNFTLVYVQPTNEEATDIYIQSVAIWVLQNILNYLELTEYPINFTTFTGRFSDICAGAWCDVSLVIPAYEGMCAQEVRGV